MPGVYHVSLDLLKDEMAELISLGIKSVIVFGVPEEKTPAEPRLFTIMALCRKGLLKLKSIILK